MIRECKHMRECLLLTQIYSCFSISFLTMSLSKSGDGSEDESQIDESQLTLVMESIQEQFRSYNSFLQDMRKDLKEIKAAQRSNTTRAPPSTTPTRF